MNLLQIASLLESINNFSEDDKKEALNYVQQLINENNLIIGEKSENDLQENVTVITESPKKRSKLPIKKRKNSVIKRPRISISRQRLKVLKCQVCNETKKTKLSLLKHMELHIGTPISCTSCHRTFNSKLSFDFHLAHLCKKKKTLASKRFKCPECPQVTT